MRSPRLTILLTLALATAPAAADEFKMLTRPAYKLYTICSKRPDMTEADIRLFAESFSTMHGKFSREQIDAIRRINPEFKALTYINSTYTRSEEDVFEAESKYRQGLAMLLAAELAEAIGPGETRFRLLPVTGSKEVGGHGESGIAVRASTVGGDYSSRDPDKPSARFYVFWIRVGDELMRVNQFDRKTGRVEVARAFAGTTAAAHAAGAKVFSPVYLGYERKDKDKYPGQHPGGGEGHLRYVLDPAHDEGNRWKAEIALRCMQEEGVDGVWLDTFGTGDFNLSDCLGRQAEVWNFARSEVYRRDDFRAGQERKIAFIQNYVKERLGKYPYLVANNLKPLTYYPGHGGMRNLLLPTAIKPRPLDGFCMENGLSPSQEGWRERIQMLMDAAQNGLAAMPVLGGAGGKSVLSEPDTPDRDRLERFGYASYLLAVERGGKTLMGTYAFYQQGERRFVKLHPIYYYPIGDPAETVKPEAIDRYLQPGTKVYARKFTGGLVLVNASETACPAVDLGQAYLDPDTRQTVRRIAMPAGSGKILLTRLD